MKPAVRKTDESDVMVADCMNIHCLGRNISSIGVYLPGGDYEGEDTRCKVCGSPTAFYGLRTYRKNGKVFRLKVLNAKRLHRQWAASRR